MNKPSTTPVERDVFIAAMRNVASSVTVVTTNGPAGKHGATVSAFTSVSADPPSVLVCLHGESRIAKAVRENGNFAVSVLPKTDADLAMRFAGKDDLQLESRFASVPHTDWAAPHIDDCTSFSCDVTQVIQEGSHIAVFGAVMWAGSGDEDPLLYFDGTFGAFQAGDNNG